MKFKFTILLFLPFFSITLSAQKTATLIYIDQYKDIAIKEMKRTGIPASITLAQGIVESNSGESNLALNFNNHFGIKCKTDWKGETTYQDDDTKQECFRVYPNANASFIDHSNFIKARPNYAPLFQLDPVDDSAWAIGLKKAGYATASDYANKLMKVMDDYELSQFNFPELNDENDTAASETITVTEKPTVVTKTIEAKNTTLDKKETSTSLLSEAPKEVIIAIVDKKDTPIAVKKDSTIEVKVVKDSASNYLNQVSLPINNIKGIEPSKNSAVVTEIKMNSIGKDTIIDTKPITLANASYPTPTNDTITKVIVKNVSVTKADTLNTYKKPTSIYPDKEFKINQVSVIWAKAGTSLLQIATEHNIPLFKIFVFNDLKESDLLAEDQLLFLGNKKAEGDKSFHLVVAGESLYDISQKEGIQLKKIKEYNPGISDNPAAGAQLILVKPKEQKTKLSLNK
jgi:LysM repeat protein